MPGREEKKKKKEKASEKESLGRVRVKEVCSIIHGG